MRFVDWTSVLDIRKKNFSEYKKTSEGQIIIARLQPHLPKQVHKDRRQGVRVQPQFPPHPAHQARQPSLPAGAAGPVHLDQFHSDQRRSGGPAAGRRRQHGET